MTLDELVALCKSRKWDELKEFFCHGSQEIYPRVFAAAVIEVYCDDPKYKQTYGLNSYVNSLSNQPVSDYGNLLTNTISLLDLSAAYQIAMSEQYLKDKNVGELIVKFVRDNKMKLKGVLDAPNIPDEIKQFLHKTFGPFKFTKAEQEAYFKNDFERRNKQIRSGIIMREKLSDLLVEVFNLKRSQIDIRGAHESRMEGMDFSSYLNLGNENNIYFKNIPRKVVAEITETLKSLKLPANSSDMDIMFGKIEDMIDKLTDFRDSLNAKASVVPISMFKSAKEHWQAVKDNQVNAPGKRKIGIS